MNQYLLPPHFVIHSNTLLKTDMKALKILQFLNTDFFCAVMHKTYYVVYCQITERSSVNGNNATFSKGNFSSLAVAKRSQFGVEIRL